MLSKDVEWDKGMPEARELSAEVDKAESAKHGSTYKGGAAAAAKSQLNRMPPYPGVEDAVHRIVTAAEQAPKADPEVVQVAKETAARIIREQPPPSEMPKDEPQVNAHRWIKANEMARKLAEEIDRKQTKLYGRIEEGSAAACARAAYEHLPFCLEPAEALKAVVEGAVFGETQKFGGVLKEDSIAEFARDEAEKILHE